MFIRRLRIARFRHIRDATIGPLGEPPLDSDLVALVGANGAGKSSVLELLGHALSNSWSLTWNIRRSFPKSSFEVEIGLTDAEIDLIIARLEHPTGVQQQAIEYLRTKRAYARSFGFAEGEYAKEPPVHNQAHALVTSTLRDYYNRALGFFLRSDRTYPVNAYQQRKLIDKSERGDRQYVWNLAFNTSDIQYQDMYDFLVEQHYHHDRRLGMYHRRRSAGTLDAGASEPINPLGQYDRLLERLFPGYSFADPPADIPDNLYISLPCGDRVPFHDLSSGEKEVFFILSFFLRNDVRDAVIVLDEPELHLHPELGRLLIRTMQEIRPGNQIWVATHSGEIIDEAGRDRLFFLHKDAAGPVAGITPATDDNEATRLLRGLFGYSGYMGVARAMVFTEGSGASVDRKVFGRLFSSKSGAVRIIPSGGCESLPRINAAILHVLNATLSSCEFFLVRDRDYLHDAEAEAMQERSDGRLWVLSRNQIENYLLDAEAIARVEREVLDQRISSQEVDRILTRAARAMAGEVLREMIAFRMNRRWGPLDLSLERVLDGQPCLTAEGEWLTGSIDSLRSRFVDRIRDAQSSMQEVVSSTSANAVCEECQCECLAAVNGSAWRLLFPGKRLLSEYAKLRGHRKVIVPALTNSLVRNLGAAPARLPEDLKRIVDAVVGDSDRRMAGHDSK
ncbi:MAG: AAA family ATPase [Phycisphaerales bacterium]|nr:AAA family ATPase [Phycisphaerales bacterium]